MSAPARRLTAETDELFRAVIFLRVAGAPTLVAQVYGPYRRERTARAVATRQAWELRRRIGAHGLVSARVDRTSCRWEAA